MDSAVMAVSTNPGHTALAVTPCGATSAATQRVNPNYERLAFEEPASDSTRITIDRNVRFHTTRESTSAGFGGIIMEVKCANGVPKWLADFRRDLALDGPSRFSKFARAVGELGTERLLKNQ